MDLDNSHTSEQTETGHLLGAGDIRRIAAEAGISPTKKFGQNFVIDPGTVRRITREAGVDASTNVLEVGPGLGSLTLALLETGARVTAVEIDPALAERLPETVAEFMPEAANRLTIVKADALSLSPETLPQFAPNPRTSNPFTLVSNLPYNVATPIVLTLLERFSNLDHFLVMVQKEVADRLVAKPGSKIYGAPSVKLAWYGVAERAGLVGRNVFWPAPNVDSALVSFTRYQDAPATDGSEDSGNTNNPNAIEHVGSNKHEGRNVEATSPKIRPAKPVEIATEPNHEKVFELIDAAFGQRRKTLHAALKKLVPNSAYEAAGIDPTRRGETLTIAEFAALDKAVANVGA
ncbi:16S rRNA (adenine(1518)-N(6)/adenine(1519)-N(6))-dimethyltransferase RsmA [Bifidobacterium sp. ESL0790]|uniref:16S rRNA (adenine(1518)-N(6)/adenine(1519)-N(6))- dimethyltransferase RsmA n=1 Tax=Bifidobacterium sp. ESL0790 TaxID=2983233 RepID=UPI0023F9E315|nr:16S rRNA (adenine(1518)-N(6)/adenine(1519)-N(6))-dimethyltransferase RsmA [Bifidobacterium sp. ESL0790]WEV73270.1 16S rRNA (adenine(1518)-N(6)/adenine(1519)-N(6))-dimethyltransferase RsmA [Bifidobacterium sp. ESL0790]